MAIFHSIWAAASVVGRRAKGDTYGLELFGWRWPSSRPRTGQPPLRRRGGRRAVRAAAAAARDARARPLNAPRRRPAVASAPPLPPHRLAPPGLEAPHPAPSVNTPIPSWAPPPQTPLTARSVLRALRRHALSILCTHTHFKNIYFISGTG